MSNFKVFSSPVFSSSKDLVADIFEQLTILGAHDKMVTGMPTGYSHLDLLTAGFQPSDLIIVAARPSMGKTAFALNIAMNAAVNENISACIFSMHVSAKQLMKRMLSAKARVDASRLRRPATLSDEDWVHIMQAADSLSHAPLIFGEIPGLSISALVSHAHRIKSERGIGLIIVDNLQYLRANRRMDSPAFDNIAAITLALKVLACELSVPIVALSPLDRELEKRADKRPRLCNMHESCVQDADVIIFIYRDAVYKYQKPSERPLIEDAEIIVAKNRNGPVGVVKLFYHSAYTVFVEKDCAF